MKLWLDDLRPAPPGWTWAKDQAEFARLARRHLRELEAVDLDFFLEHGDSLECCDRLLTLCREAHRPLPRWGTHSSSDHGNRQLRERLAAHEAVLAAELEEWGREEP